MQYTRWQTFLVGVVVLGIAQACADADDGSRGTGGSGGQSPMTAGTSGTNGGSGGESGPGEMDTVDFVSESGISLVASLPDSAYVAIVLIDRATSCEEFVEASDARASWPNSRSVLMTLSHADLTELEPGSYPVDGSSAPDQGPHGSITLSVFDEECGRTTTYARQGTITLTSVDGGELAGTYDVTLPEGHLEGAFSTVPCVDYGWTDSSPPTTCY